MNLSCSEAELSTLLRDPAFTRAYGFQLESIAEGECTLFVPFRKECERPGGIVSGQVFMAAPDVAMWLAIKTRLGLEDASVTVEMKTNFLGSCKQQGFRCSARLHKLGRQLIFGTAECKGEDSGMLTHHTITYMRPQEAGTR